LTDIVVVSGYNLLAAGCSGPIICALSRKYGKRPCFLASTMFDIIGTALGEAKLSYNYLLAARIIQGFSTSAFESLIVAVVGDLYFVHQRGVRIAIINFVLNAASSLSSIICGQVYANLGYFWLFHMFQIFLVVQFVAMFLFCPETTYLRETQYETDFVGEKKLEEILEQKTLPAAEHREVAGAAEEADSRTIPDNVPAKKSFVQELAIYTRVYSQDNILKYLAGPFICLLNPAACYAIIASGLLNSWYVGSAIILSGIFAGPPWHFGPAQVGYIGAGPFLGGMVGSILAAWLGDPVIKFMGKRNHGI
jgi:MFS family permease